MKYKKMKKKKKKKLPNKLLLIIFPILFIPILLFFTLRSIYFSYDNKDDNNDNFLPNKIIYSKEKFDSYIEAFNKAKDFINNNIEGKLINTKKLNLSLRPIVTVVIPCYDCHKFLSRALRSIQNQNFFNYEIVIVNDGSNTVTVSYLEQMQKEDNRIRVIHNKRNMGLLYTRSIGSLSANGTYIIPLDSDDLFLDKDVFSILTNIAKKGNFDIIIYNSISTDLKPDVYTTKFGPEELDRFHEPNRVLFQPDLGYYSVSSTQIDEIKLIDPHIHGKFFRTNIYKKALNKLGEERYSRFVVSGEDAIVNNCIFNIARNAKFIAYYGYIYVKNYESVSQRQNSRIPSCRKYLNILDPFIDFTLNTKRNKKILVNFILFIFKEDKLKFLLRTNGYYNKLFISCLDRIFNCNYISDEDKNEIRRKGKMLDLITYNF